ncbi:MAG: acyl-CoA thioesterase [Burkholderiaceae bacterium]|jgi:acyl-CoA thioester hydrolase|nr:acyl-CoA thioesterase [Betaproteobacteria bacterium]
MSQDLKTLTRQDFVHFMAIPTRWMDNDVYGHVNNVNYYSYFDTVVNQYLIEQGVLDIQKSPVVGLVVQTGCSYFASIAFPDLIHAGLRVTKLGNSSVRYEVGLFKNEDQQVSAAGHFIHVYVDRQTQRPVSLPEPLRAVLQQIYIPA